MKITNLFRMSSDKGRTCAFTGHRPQNLPFRFNENDDRCIALKQKLRDCIVQLIEQEGVRHFISGMAIGVDMYAAEIVLELKAEYSVWCDDSIALINEEQSGFIAVKGVQLLFAGAAAIQHHVMISADLL